MYATYSSVIAFDQLPSATDAIELVGKLGEGTYGAVHLAIDKRSGTTRFRNLHYAHIDAVDNTRIHIDTDNTRR